MPFAVVRYSPGELGAFALLRRELMEDSRHRENTGQVPFILPQDLKCE